MKSLLSFLVVALAALEASAQEPASETRLFDVSAIVAHRVPMFGPSLGPRWTHYESVEWEDEVGPWMDVDALADILREEIAPEIIESGEAEIRGSANGTLLVRGPVAMADAVERRIAEFEAAASRRYLVGVRVYELPAAQYADLLAGADPARLEGSVVLHESGSTEAWPGVRSMLKVTSRVRYVKDHDVEIAQGAQIGDPVVEAAEEGLAAELMVRPTLGGDRVAVSALLQWGKFRRPFRTVDLAVDEEYFAEKFRSDARFRNGRIELPAFDEASALLHRLIPPGTPWVVPLIRDGRLFAFRIVVEAAGGARPEAHGPIDLSIFSREKFNGRFGYGEDPEPRNLEAPVFRRYEPIESPLGDPDEVVELVMRTLRPEMWEEGEAQLRLSESRLLLVNGPPGLAEQVRTFLVRQEQLAYRPIELEVRVVSTASPVTGGEGAEPAGTVRHAVVLSAASGRWTGALLGTRMNYIADYDVEVAQEARIADPIVGQEFGGLAVNLLPRLSADGTRLSVEFESLVARLGPLQSLDSGAQTLGPVERIPAARVISSQLLQIAAGGTFVIDAGPDAAAEGRRLAIVVTNRIR